MDNLIEFWALVVDVWKNDVAGTDMGRILAATGIFIGFLLVRKLFTQFILLWIKSVVKKTSTLLDDAAVSILEEPIRFIPVVLGVFFATQHLQLVGIYAEIADNAVRSLIAFAIFWGFVRVLRPISHLMTRLEKVFTPELVEWLIKAIRIAVMLIGAATILQIWGIQVAPIIAGAGLFGVAVALGAQDLFKNLIAGMLILGEKRFRKGDWIRVEGVVEGTVENIGFRSTIIRRFDKAPVMVPNTNLSDTAVTNFSGMTHRRIYWKIGVEYRTTVDQLRQIRDEMEHYIVESPEFASPKDVSTFVRIDRFSDSSIDIMLYCFTKTTNWGEWLEIKEQLAFHIKQIVEGAGSGFAFPSQSLYIEAIPSERPELFVPPTETQT
ncbi:MAG: mechanosensitive ion channel family protein [Rhodospirillales bacterium]|jgi:MscS family membrane protein|tara:strand:+ start:2744 stop:3883 length:1140 start_codon:yes stop_codon:yes gene_type:complete